MELNITFDNIIQDILIFPSLSYHTLPLDEPLDPPLTPPQQQRQNQKNKQMIPCVEESF